MILFGIQGPDTAIQWVTFIGFVVTGAFALYSIFDKNFRNKRILAETVDDRVVGLLKDEVTILRRKVDQQGNDMQALRIIVEELKKENEVFRMVFQNRDPDSIAIRNEARQAIAAIYDTQKDIRQLYKALNKHFDRIEKAETGPVKETIVKTKERV